MFHNIIILFNYFWIINNKLIENNFLIIIHARAEHYFLHTQNVQCAWWSMNCLFSVDLILINVRLYMFLNKTPTKNLPFASFPLVQFLSIVLFVKVTYISNGSLAWVAYPGKSFGLKFIPSESDSFRFIPKSVPAPIRTHPSQSEKSFQSHLM